MKTINLTKVMNSTQDSIESTSATQNLQFNDYVVYNEMADQSSIRLNLIEQIHLQLNHFEELVERKKFLLKEIGYEIIK